jgi:hypothetical protein
MIGTMMVVMMFVEVAQHKEAAEPESFPPERPWDPIV